MLNSLHYTEGMAVDWIGDNLYWVNSAKRQIVVSRLNGTNVAKVVDTPDNPRYDEYDDNHDDDDDAYDLIDYSNNSCNNKSYGNM